jgi:LysM repeat protein
MKWRHWAILIVLLLLNYIIFSTAFTQLAAQRRPRPRPTRTPQPTFTHENVEPTPMAWIILPTNTPRPDRALSTAEPTAAFLVMTESTVTIQPTATTAIAVTEDQPAATATAVPTITPPPPTATPMAPAASVVHTIKQGETLSKIAADYGVTVASIVQANGLADANHIVTGQTLIIPVAGQVPPTATAGGRPAATRPPATNTPKPRPPSPTPTPKPPTPTPAASAHQFTAQVIWDPLVAPNCAGPAISKISIIQDTNGNPVNGARVEVNCYDNIWTSHPSGNPGEYDPGHYDFAFGQGIPQAWTCTAHVLDVNGQPVASSEVATIQFDTNDCKPHGSGHQVAILNWTKHW